MDPAAVALPALLIVLNPPAAVIALLIAGALADHRAQRRATRRR